MSPTTCFVCKTEVTMPVLPPRTRQTLEVGHITSKWLSLFTSSFYSTHNLFQA